MDWSKFFSAIGDRLRNWRYSRKPAAPDHWHIAHMTETGFRIMPETRFGSKEECQQEINAMSWHEPENPKPMRCRSEHFVESEADSKKPPCPTKDPRS